MRILIVDDDAFALGVLQQTLLDAGHEVSCAHDGEEALKILHETPFRLIISDWNMPNMTGDELCRRVREKKLPDYVYFILLTSREKPADIVAGLTAGADEFLTKPFNPLELQVRVRAAQRILALDTRDLTIFLLAKLAESRDTDTGHHLERVRLYARILADDLLDTMQSEPDFVKLIYQTSPLHDIGKVGIPDHILLKPGRLTPDEFEVMKTHTTIGWETLKAAANEYPDVAFLQTSRDVALTHHERYDGTGYPLGLHEDRIPWSGRIVALADVYDAMTSKRAYKAAISHDETSAALTEQSGRQFDPRVVAAFKRNEDAFVRVSRQYADA